MAEELGSAVLRLTVEDGDLTKKLAAAKVQVDELARQTSLAGNALAKVFSKDYRLNINDSQLVAANTRLTNLQTKLREIAAQPYDIRLNIIEGGANAGGKTITRQDIQRQAQEALSGGLSGKLGSILAGDVGSARTADLRQLLSTRLDKSNLTSGGYNVPGLKEVITQLGGNPTGKRADLVKQAKDLIATVDDSIINKLGQDLLDLKLQLQDIPTPRSGGSGNRSGNRLTPDQMAKKRLRIAQEKVAQFRSRGGEDPKFFNLDEQLIFADKFTNKFKGPRNQEVQKRALNELFQRLNAEELKQGLEPLPRVKSPRRSNPPAPPPPPRGPEGSRGLGGLLSRLPGSNKDALSNALIGGAFPLLFGQGLGASFGGAAGGGIGGKLGGGFGFGLSLVGTAVGAQFDAIIAKSAALGKALQSPIANFSAIQENALLSSKGLEGYVGSLIASGREAEAAALIQKDLAATYGGAEAAKKLASEQDRLNRSYTQLTVGLGSLSLGPIADSVQGAANALIDFKKILDSLAGISLPDLGPLNFLGPGGPAGQAIKDGRGLAGTALGLLFGGPLLGSLAIGNKFRPAPKDAAIPPPDPAAERQRLGLLSAQNKVVSAQVQGYKRLELGNKVIASQLQEQVDLQNLKARGAKAPELTARRTAGEQERQGIREEINQLERENKRAAELRAAINPISYKRAEAQAGGFTRRDLELQIAELQATRDTKLRQTPQFGSAIRGELDPQIFAATKQLAALDRDRLATQIEQNAQNAIELGAVQRQIAFAEALSATTGERSRAELQRRQQIIESINAAREAELKLGAAIDAARTRGGDAGEQQAANLVQQQLAASEQTRLKLKEGADALTQAGKTLRDDLSDAVLKFTEIRSSGQGLNRFLSQADQQKRAEQDFQLLLPRFREAQGQFQSLTGAPAPEFSGGTAAVNAAIIDFIRTVKAESDAGRNVADIQQALSGNIATLTDVTRNLASVNAALAAKDWSVSVSVNAEGQVGIGGGAFPRSF